MEEIELWKEIGLVDLLVILFFFSGNEGFDFFIEFVFDNDDVFDFEVFYGVFKGRVYGWVFVFGFLGRYYVGDVVYYKGFFRVEFKNGGRVDLGVGVSNNYVLY